MYTYTTQYSGVHPYYPPSLEIPHFIPNGTPTVQLLVVLSVVVVFIVCTCLSLSTINEQLSGTDRGAMIWFALCGCIHLFLEGYFCLNHDILAGDRSFLSEVWKEYALSDSRYLISDPFLLSMESVTAFLEGPLCCFLVLAIFFRWPSRFPIQLGVSLGQLYGVLLYFMTEAFNKKSHIHPNPYYFWVYYVGMNLPWVVFPFLLICQSWSHVIPVAAKRIALEERKKMKKVQ